MDARNFCLNLVESVMRALQLNRCTNARSCKSRKMREHVYCYRLVAAHSSRASAGGNKRCKYAPVQTSRRRRQHAHPHRLLLRHARAAAVVERLGKAQRRRVLLGRRTRGVGYSPRRRPGRAQEAAGVVPQRASSSPRRSRRPRTRRSWTRSIEPKPRTGLPALRVFGQILDGIYDDHDSGVDNATAARSTEPPSYQRARMLCSTSSPCRRTTRAGGGPRRLGRAARGRRRRGVVRW